jgi:hypothetical protein
MILPVNWNVVAIYARGIWAVGGPLVGVLVGASIANRNQRQQWISDCKKEEYSELLGLMSKSLSTFILAKANVIPKGFEREKALVESWSGVMENVHSKIFISAQLEQLSVFERWMTALKFHHEGNAQEPLAKSLGEILRDVRNAALKDLGEDS